MKGKGGNVKGKFHRRIGHEGPEEEYRYSSTFYLTSALDGGWVVNATTRPLYPRERDPVPIVQGAGWAPGSVLTAAENPRTFQPVASRYINYPCPKGEAGMDRNCYTSQYLCFLTCYFRASMLTARLGLTVNVNFF
jgi:hypothetical protein